MNRKEKHIQPGWINEAPVGRSFRSVFKYGDPLGFKHPSALLLDELKSTFNMTDADFSTPVSTGNEVVSEQIPCKLSEQQIGHLTEICSEKNVSTDTYQRLKYSTGKTVEEAMKLRKGQINKISDLVIHPRDKKEVSRIVAYCNQERIPIYVHGGGSSVNLGLLPEKGGITMVLGTHLNRLVEVNELNQTATVQAGMLGPAFEAELNDAKSRYGTKHNFTCGHFPQSFEYSSVGGWVVTLGSGQQSSYYGDAADLVLGLEIVTPAGEIKTYNFPACANGPKILDIIKGSEGTYGVVVELTWKLYRYMPENRQYFGFIFPTWSKAIDACREISQGEFGMPAVFRISDPEETHHGLKLYGIEGTIFDKLMTWRG